MRVPPLSYYASQLPGVRIASKAIGWYMISTWVSALQMYVASCRYRNVVEWIGHIVYCICTFVRAFIGPEVVCCIDRRRLHCLVRYDQHKPGYSVSVRLIHGASCRQNYIISEIMRRLFTFVTETAKLVGS